MSCLHLHFITSVRQIFSHLKPKSRKLVTFTQHGQITKKRIDKELNQCICKQDPPDATPPI